MNAKAYTDFTRRTKDFGGNNVQIILNPLWYDIINEETKNHLILNYEAKELKYEGHNCSKDYVPLTNNENHKHYIYLSISLLLRRILM